MATEIDMDRKPTIAEWLAGDAWFEGLLRETLAAYREAYQQAHDSAARRFGLDPTTGQAGPQVRGA